MAKLICSNNFKTDLAAIYLRNIFSSVNDKTHAALMCLQERYFHNNQQTQLEETCDENQDQAPFGKTI